MHPDLKTLIELQRVDQTLAELTSRIDAAPLQTHALRDQLTQFIHATGERKARLASNQKERRELEGEAQMVRSKISKHKEQLYQVKTNEQYRAMLKEIEGEEGNLRNAEDRMLEKMVEAEQIEQLVREASSRLAGEKARVEGEIRELELSARAAEQDRVQLLSRRRSLSEGLSGDMLGLYERLRKARNGIALAEIREGLCSGCHVRLRPQAYNDVRASDRLLTCETCSRILYYVAPPEGGVSEKAVGSGQPATLQK